MIKYTFSIDPSSIEQVKQIYQSHLVENADDDVFFVAAKNDFKIEGYKNGELHLTGNFLSHEITRIHQAIDNQFYEAVGSDEVGTGDVFGPVVVCACQTTLDDVQFLIDLGVKDSKALSDKKIMEIAPILAKRLTHSILILDPLKYNALTDKGYNMNKVKAYLHNHAIIKTTEKFTHSVPVIVDQFCEPHLYYNYLKGEKLIFRDLSFYTKAETVHVSVAAASIIARYAFLAKMHSYSNQVGYKLQKGAGSEVDVQLKQLIEDKGLDFMPKIAKMNFKNFTKIKTKKKPSM